MKFLQFIRPFGWNFWQKLESDWQKPVGLDNCAGYNVLRLLNKQLLPLIKSKMRFLLWAIP